jgi:hypothetical protein
MFNKFLYLISQLNMFAYFFSCCSTTSKTSRDVVFKGVDFNIYITLDFIKLYVDLMDLLLDYNGLCS